MRRRIDKRFFSCNYFLSELGFVGLGDDWIVFHLRLKKPKMKIQSSLNLINQNSLFELGFIGLGDDRIVFYVLARKTENKNPVIP